MCVICVINKGVPTPPDNVIRAMHRCNPDGTGIVTPTDHYKGMSVELLLRHLHKRNIDEPCLMHFRLATHGSIKKANCHPFHDDASGTWFMHNGILGISPTGDMTDSETAFREILAPEIQAHGLRSDNVRYAVRNIIGGSRFAFLQGSDVQLYGQYERWNGCLFSNLRFQWYLF